jgi:hypothetical protein
MIYELIVTSVPRGLQAGTSGFTTVLRTRGIPPRLGDDLARASGYRHVYPEGDPRNPQVRSHVVMQSPAGMVSVLSRIVDAGRDYSNRSNKLAHHIALDAADVAARAKSSPAAVLLAAERSGALQRQWAGEPREQPVGPAVPNVPAEPGACAAWARVAGDAGWAGFLVDRAMRREPTWIIAPPGVDLLELFAEALTLVNYPQRWTISFTTYALSAGDALWLGTVDGSPEAQTARGQQRIAVIDLARRPPLTAQSPTIEAARGTGQVPWKRDASRPAAAVVAPAVGPAASGPTLGGPTIGQPLGGPAAHSHFGPPTTVPPPIGGGPGAPPPIGGRGPGGPPMHDPLGRPVASAGWGGSGADGAYVPEPVGRSARNPIPVYALVGVGLAALVVVGIVMFVPSFPEQVLHWAGGGAGPGGGAEEVAVRPAAPALMPRRDPSPNPPPDKTGSAGPQPPTPQQPTPQQPTPQQPTPQQPTPQQPTPQQPTPQQPPPSTVQKWQAFQAERAKPGGRYPLKSLDGEQAEVQSAKICEVGDVDVELLLPTTAIEQGIDVWQLACSRPDKTKREWVFACQSWPQGKPNEKKPHRLGSARVEDNGWLVVDLDARTGGPNVCAARQALTCGPLTLETPLLINGAPDQRQTFVQLRRPKEYGPIRIEHFFANKLIWPKAKPKDGKWSPGAFVPIPDVPIPAYPWASRMIAEKNDVVLVCDGERKPHFTEVLEQKGSVGSRGPSPCGTGIIWKSSFSRDKVPLGLIRTDVQFLSVPGETGNVFNESGRVLGVRIGAAQDVASQIMNYDLLGHLNNTPALVYRDETVQPMPVDDYFPITNNVVKNFKDKNVEIVAKAAISSFIQAWLPADKYKAPDHRSRVVANVLTNLAIPVSARLAEWPDKLRDAIAAGDLYKEWCNNPPLGKPPPAQPADPRQQANWVNQKNAWEAAKAAFDNRLKANRMKMAEFATWLGSRERPPDARPEYDDVIAVLQSMCTAIEKLSLVDACKRETLELLETMQTADLEITGSLVVCPPTEETKECVLVTFTKGKDPVVVSDKPNKKQHSVKEKEKPLVDGLKEQPPEGADVPKQQGSGANGPFLTP